LPRVAACKTQAKAEQIDARTKEMRAVEQAGGDDDTTAFEHARKLGLEGYRLEAHHLEAHRLEAL
jgi:hypothetical protein